MKNSVISIFLTVSIIFLAGCSTNLNSKAQTYCDGDHDVYICSTSIKAVSIIPGAGATYYRADGTELNCPVVAPDSMSEECRELLFDDNCTEVCRASLPSDEDTGLLELLEKETGIGFSDTGDLEISWKTVVGDQLVKAQGLEAKRISDQQYRAVESFFVEQGFEIDIYNVLAGTISGATGYIKGKNVCTVSGGVTGYKEATGQWIPPETDEKDVEIKCGLLEKEIDETENWQVYTNEKYGYSLKYPTDCLYGPLPGYCKQSPPEERPRECLCYFNAEDPNSVSLGTFTGTKSDLTGASFVIFHSIYVDYYSPPAGTDLVEWVKENFSYYEDIPDEINMEIDGIPAVKVYTPFSGMAWSQDDFFFIRDSILFQISILDVDNSDNRKLYDQIISSIEFN